MNRTNARRLRLPAWLRLAGENGRREISGRRRLLPSVEGMEARALLATLHVGPGETYATIQAAVDASNSNDTIAVDPGTYVEQVTIPDSKDNLTIKSTKPLKATIQAPATVSGNGAVVTNDGASGLTLTGFTISGPATGLHEGVLITDGGSAFISRNHITNIQETTFALNQTGHGIVVSNATATIDRNTIDDYQKTGILVDGTAGTTAATISNNTITGIGLTSLIAQNGIQISNGASALITKNDISDNLSATNFAAGGVILINAGPTLVDNNDIDDNDVGVGVQDTNLAIISNNKITDSTDDGIELLGSTSNTLVANNSSRNGGLDGIFVDATATGNFIINNKLKKNGLFDAEDDSTGSGTAGTGNFWINNKGKTDNKGGQLVH